mgnify:FL=1
MNIYEFKRRQEEALKGVELNASAFKVGIILMTIWNIVKPVLLWTVVFFAIGIVAILTVFVKGISGKK